MQEKRRMRSRRKCRQRKKFSKVNTLKEEIKHQISLKSDLDKKVNLYKCMSRTYWERWQWELQQRRQLVINEKRAIRAETIKTVHSTQLQEIDPSLLVDMSTKDEDLFIGRGSFAVVKLQSFRGIKVAVKELLPRTLLTDVLHESSILVKLSHPYVPYLFGICTRKQAYKIIMQFEGISNSCKPLTLQEALTK